MGWFKRIFGIGDSKSDGLEGKTMILLEENTPVISEPVLAMLEAICTRPKTIKWEIDYANWKDYSSCVPIKATDTVVNETWTFIACMNYTTMLTRIHDVVRECRMVLNTPTWLTEDELNVLTETIRTVYGARSARYRALKHERYLQEKQRAEGRRRVFDAAERRRLTKVYKKA